MKINSCYRAAILGACALSLVILPAWAQRSAAGSASAPSPGAGTVGTPATLGSSTSNRSNTSTNSNNPNGIDQSRPMFLSGNVMFDDGTPPNIDVRIERVCRGNPHVESHTDSHGNFSFQVGSPLTSDMSAFDASSGNAGSSRSSSPFGGVGSGTGGGNNNLFDCELRAAYPGYVSEIVELGSRRSLDDPNVGTIVLHRLANVKGTTISLTSAMAPKSALKSFQKGMLLAQKAKFEEAEGKFQDAIQEYPKYAEAWFERGQVEEHLNKLDEANTSYLAAIKADAKYVSPYDHLARLSAQQSKWEDTAKYSKEAVDLNPVEFPSSFWYNAIANYNLKNDAEAEKSAQSVVKLDKRHRYPEAERLLADLASSHGDLDTAAVHLKAYLDIAPNAKNAEQSKNLLARIEAARAAQAKNTAGPAVVPPVSAPPQ